MLRARQNINQGNRKDRQKGCAAKDGQGRWPYFSGIGVEEGAGREKTHGQGL